MTKRKIVVVLAAVALLVFGAGVAAATTVFNRWDSPVGSAGFSLSTHEEDQRNIGALITGQTEHYLSITCPEGTRAIAGNARIWNAQEVMVPVVGTYLNADEPGVWHAILLPQPPSAYPLMGRLYVTCASFS